MTTEMMENRVHVDFTGDHPMVSARDLHEALEIRTVFRQWFPRMCEYGFSEGTDYENRVSLMVNFRKTLEERKGSGFVLLASGISDFERGRDMRTQDVFERADNLMYDNKQICKEENNRLIYKQLISAISSAGDQNDFA